jgi:tRNA (cmo5U34)-methyltransferase
MEIDPNEQAMAKDRIYALPHQRVGEFAFDEDVASVFPDMISRSVPGYASILSMIEQLAARYVQPNTNVYDLGCSLGAATKLIRGQTPGNCTIHAVDNSPAMLNRLQNDIEDWACPSGGTPCAVELHLADIREFPLQAASFVVINFTLQFLPPDERTSVLARAYQALLPGGALLLSEKVRFDDPHVDDLLIELHHDFKRAHGYSDLEIAQKRTAIESRLIPESLEIHTERLRTLGFAIVTTWFQCFNFASMLAVKA